MLSGNEKELFDIVAPVEPVQHCRARLGRGPLLQSLSQAEAGDRRDGQSVRRPCLTQRPEAITLSIGDGANDVNMITEAHVGIGIKGLEGQQAARAADFSIGEFRMLKRLLFFHGRESYRKNATLILYNFFKNVVLCMPQFWFGINNYLSGQTLYEAINYQLFNITYTSLPIILYALFDKQTTDLILLADPIFYEPGPKRLLFNTKRFLVWFSWASTQALCLVYLAYSPLIQRLFIRHRLLDGGRKLLRLLGGRTRDVHGSRVSGEPQDHDFLERLFDRPRRGAGRVFPVLRRGLGLGEQLRRRRPRVHFRAVAASDRSVWENPHIYTFFFIITAFAAIDWGIHKIVGRPR